MPIHFKLTERFVGYAAKTTKPGEQVQICYREPIGPEDASHLMRQLESFHGALFSKIPSLPSPSIVDHLLVVLSPDLECTAYVNELSMMHQVRTTRGVEKDTPVYVGDISDVVSVDLGVEVSSDCGIVFVRSTGWKRSLFFDFGPLLPDVQLRTYPLEHALAQQALLLLGLLSNDAAMPGGGQTRLHRMEEGLARLRQLLSDRCEDEATYQELLERHPWMLGGYYKEVNRHRRYDDRSIPDFTAMRCYDGCHDIIELKQPFLKLFRKDSGYTSSFNDAWNQAERYLSFAVQQRSYLREEKELRFENPRCVLLIGNTLSDQELREVRKKESLGRSISVLTYDQLVEMASHVVALMKTAQESAAPDGGERPANSALQLTSPSLTVGPRS